MSARLRPMREDEFDSFVARSRADYADDMIRNGGLPPDAAHQKADGDVAQLFPAGFASDVELRVVEDENGAAVGHLVYGEQERYGQRQAFLYDIAIDEAHRGRGLGREAMLLLEGEVREQGLDRLQLNVFGGNDVARSLYRSLGFHDVAVQMAKVLAP